MFSFPVQSGMHLKVGNWAVFACESMFFSAYVTPFLAVMNGSVHIARIKI